MEPRGSRYGEMWLLGLIAETAGREQVKQVISKRVASRRFGMAAIVNGLSCKDFNTHLLVCLYD